MSEILCRIPCRFEDDFIIQQPLLTPCLDRAVTMDIVVSRVAIIRWCMDFMVGAG